MAIAFPSRECVREEAFKLVWSRPLTFDEFLDLFMGREDLVELVDGAVVERPMVQYGHERLLFIDQRKRRVRLLRKRGDGYEENEIMTGTVCFETLPGFQVEVDWLFDEPRPAVRGLLDRLLTGEGA